MARSKKKEESATVNSKLDKLNVLLKDKFKKYGGYDTLKISLDPNKLKESLPHWKSGIFALDYLIGGKPNSFGIPPCPGLPKGKIIQLYGAEGSGKSTVALTAAASIIQQGGTVMYIDCEAEVNVQWAAKIGIPMGDESKFTLVQPNDMEQALLIGLEAVKAGIELVVYDSVGSAQPLKELEKLESMDEAAKVGVLASMWSRWLPAFKMACAKTDSVFLGISQLRSNIGVMGHGEKYITQGGKAWNYFPSLRIKISNLGKEKTEKASGLDKVKTKETIGSKVEAKLDKCKVSQQNGNAVTFFIEYGGGVDNVKTLIESAIGYKIIQKSGGWFEWSLPSGDTIKVQGIEKLKAELESKSLFSMLESLVMEKIYGSFQEGAIDEDEDEDYDAGENSLNIDALQRELEASLESNLDDDDE